ncbi:MAG: hypothetical protein ACFFB0_03310 [Promethearchaeota archaeon]
MLEENNKDKEEKYYSGRTNLEKIDQILSDTSLTAEERKNLLEKHFSMLEKERPSVGFDFLKKQLMERNYMRSKQMEDDQTTRAILYLTSHIRKSQFNHLLPTNTLIFIYSSIVNKI